VPRLIPPSQITSILSPTASMISASWSNGLLEPVELTSAVIGHHDSGRTDVQSYECGFEIAGSMISPCLPVLVAAAPIQGVTDDETEIVSVPIRL
jgi:hypothetical protein